MGKDRSKEKTSRKGRTRSRGGLIRETAYLYEDEAAKLEKMAERERCSKSEIIRRALRRMFRGTQ